MRYDGIWDEDIVKNIYQEERNGDQCEGYVVRLADSFKYGDFRRSCAKYVREGHVSPHNWKRMKIVFNKIKGG